MNTVDGLILSAYFSDGMVFQRDEVLVVNGWDNSDQAIKVTFNDKSYSTKADKEKQWFVEIPPQAAGGPYNLVIEGSQTKTIQNVWIGEVWLLSGQSNMELPLSRVMDEFVDEIKINESNLPYIRQFRPLIEAKFATPNQYFEAGQWMVVSEENYDQFSALAFFFAKKLYQALSVPIGIIHTAIGGSPIEAWMSETTLKKLNLYDEEADQWKDARFTKKQVETVQAVIEDWHQEVAINDLGRLENWEKINLPNDNWRSILLPNMFNDTELKEFNGSVWLKKTFELSPADLNNDYFRLRLGTLINSDTTYVNGIKVGETAYRYPPRKYLLDKEYLNIGENEITVHLTIEQANGGFIADLPYQLEVGQDVIDLSGEWFYRIGTQAEVLNTSLFLHNKATALYNSAVSSLKHIKVKGILFYQGESNTGNPTAYGQLMEAMVKDWRSILNAELPFYYVQLANYLEPTALEDDMKWAELREQQHLALKNIPNAEMVTAIDVGQANELHPTDKKTIADRLAEIALDREYIQEGFKYLNPQLQTYQLSNQELTLVFENINGSLEVIDLNDPLIELESKNGSWEKVDAFIQKSTIKINNKDFFIGQGIRYAWRNNPEGLLRDSHSKLPVLPFRFVIEKESENN